MGNRSEKWQSCIRPARDRSDSCSSVDVRRACSASFTPAFGRTVTSTVKRPVHHERPTRVRDRQTSVSPLHFYAPKSASRHRALRRVHVVVYRPMRESRVRAFSGDVKPLISTVVTLPPVSETPRQKEKECDQKRPT
jgi:hypothetical protein